MYSCIIKRPTKAFYLGDSVLTFFPQPHFKKQVVNIIRPNVLIKERKYFYSFKEDQVPQIPQMH